MNLPRLYENDKFTRLLYPINLSVVLNITPLSTATITLPKGEGVPARSYIEIYTPYGSAGMFRVRSPHDSYGSNTTTAELEHMIAEVGDYLVKEEIDEMMPAQHAIKRAFKHYTGKHWQLGSIVALGSRTVAVQCKYDRVLDTILSVLEQTPGFRLAFDFSTSPWTVKVVKNDTEVTAEGRLARNISSATISYDDSELCTRVWYKTYIKDKKGKQTGTAWKKKDASTLKTYGVVEGTVSTSTDQTDDEIAAIVDAYLSDHKEPRVSVSIEGAELYAITGESMDKFSIGKLFRLALPDYGVTVSKNITSLSWNDVYNDPGRVTVSLGDEPDTVVTFLHNLDAKGAGGGGGGKSKKNSEDEWSEYQSDWKVQNDYIGGYVAKTDKYGDILEQAGLDINSKGILIYAKTKNGLLSTIEQTATRIAAKVMDKKLDNYSTIEQTSKKIRTAVGSAKSTLYSTIEQTSTHIYTSVRNYVSGNYSTITQTESKIATAVGSASSSLYSTIEQTSTSVYTAVSNYVSDNYSSITQTESKIEASVSSAKSTLYSTIEQTSTSIYTNVTDHVSQNYSTITQTASDINLAVSSAKSEVNASIDIQSDRIGLVVTGTGANAKIRPAEIVASINNGASTIKLGADHIDIDGLVSKLAAMTVSVYDISAEVGSIDSLNVGTLLTVGDDKLKVGTHTVSWKSYGARFCALSTERHFMYSSSSGGTTVAGTVRGRLCNSYTDTTIYYLGR